MVTNAHYDVMAPIHRSNFHSQVHSSLPPFSFSTTHRTNRCSVVAHRQHAGQVHVAWLIPPLPGSSIKAGATHPRNCIPGTELGDGLAQARKSLGQIWLFPLYHQLGVNSLAPQLFQTAGHGTQRADTACEGLFCPAGRSRGAGPGSQSCEL